ISDSKWTRYFLNRNSNELINSLRKDNRFVRFGDIASVDVGITTGNNDYFCVDNQTVNKFDLKEISKPLIARSVNLNGIKFTREDWKYNINRGAKTYLIDFPDIPYEQYSYRQREYIEKGEREEQNTGYKCRIRQRWYRVPSIWLPDAFLLRRNHLYPKFILNSEVEAVSTDTMHRIRFNEDIDHNRVLLSYYNSITLAFTEIEGRSYGGGVLEILPGEFEKVIIPDLQSNELITNDIVNYLIQEIDTRVRNNNDIEDILDLVDETILIEILGIDRNIVDQFRKMWLILKNRRLNRKRIKK
ncbi:TPA: class I SAM-dependent methyltransferase, partial [Clostridioides difficile]|nr:class I SAM-dependent methyltransferase [Clostridioides difficile]